MGSAISHLKDSSIEHFAFQAPSTNQTKKTPGVRLLRCRKGSQIAISFTPAPDSSNTLDKYDDIAPLVLFSHGNAVDIASTVEYCKWFSQQFECNVLTYDYINYGMSSQGCTTEENIKEAIDRVYDFVKNNLCATKIFLVGKSIGTAPTTYLASSRVDYLGVILISPLSSGVRCLSISRFFPSILLHKLDGVFCPLLQLMPKIYKPTLMIHGNQDNVVPVQCTNDLYDALPRENKNFLPVFLGNKYRPCSHNNIETDFEKTFCDNVMSFMKVVLEDLDMDVPL